MGSQAFSLPFLRKEQIAHDTWSFFFDRKDVSFNFLPGQYNRVSLPIVAKDTRGISRMFTIASSPTEKNMLMITTKHGISDFKNAFFELVPGTPVQFFGPMGGFVLSEKNKTPRVLLAGGIGITTFRSMLMFAAAKKLPQPITLLASFSTYEEMVYYEELTSLAKENSLFTVIFTVTRPEESTIRWTGETGRITPDLIKKYVDNTETPIYMISGSPDFVEGMVSQLQEELHVPEENIKVDQFTGY